MPTEATPSSSQSPHKVGPLPAGGLTPASRPSGPTETNPEDTAGLPVGLLLSRVRLYLKVTFFINLFFVSVSILFRVTGLQEEEWVVDRWRMGVSVVATIANGLAWAIAERTRSKRVATWLELLSTLSLVEYYVSVVLYFRTEGELHPGNQYVALLLVTIVLVLRASVVPSPLRRTLFLGLYSVGGATGMAFYSFPDPFNQGIGWMAIMGLVVVAVTGVTSSTIYGLQQQMRAARRLGQYVVERKLGEGGMGRVYLASHALLQRRTAVKLLRSHSDEARVRFRREVQIASSLTHPNTIEIYDYGRTPDGAFYFAMEYVEGATFQDVVQSTGPMPPARVRHLLRQAAGSLSEAHARGLMHRDLKPQNLMLCQRGGAYDTVKVLDFGLVRDLGEGASEAEETQLTGTPLYLAPEAIVDAGGFLLESDIYALGAVGYYLLAGHPPFAQGDLFDVLSDHLATPPPPLAISQKAPELAALVLRCLAKTPSDRPADAREFLQELKGTGEASWSPQDAQVWWAEHRDVIEHHQGDDSSLGSAKRLRIVQA